MKNLAVKLSALFLFLSIGLMPTSSNAAIIPPCSFCPTVGPVEDASMVIDQVSKALYKSQTFKNQNTIEKVNELNAVKSTTNSKSPSKLTGIGNLFKKSKKKDKEEANNEVTVPATREISSECDIVDIYSYDSVKDSVYNLFLAYPSNDVAVQGEYKSYSRKFYNDTIIETYILTRELENRLNELRDTLSKLPAELIYGTNGSKTADDKIGVLENQIVIKETKYKIMLLWEEIMALKAQYIAARYIDMESVKAPYIGSQSNNMIVENKTKYASRETLVFGQLSTYKYDRNKNSPVKFEKAPAASSESPFAGNEGKLEQLKKLDPVYDHMQSALKVHNLINSLPEKKAIFDEHARYVRLHNKTIEDLKISDKCVMQYLGRYYQDPEKVWTGRYIGDLVNAYEMRQGLSGWAIKAFDIAKANTVNPVDADSFGTIDAELLVDPKNATVVEDIDSIQEVDQQSTPGLALPGDSNELERNTRASKMLAWQIGSQASKMLAKDQYMETSNWGTPFKKFPIWNDQKNFYNQYIFESKGKYENIKKFLKQIDLRNSVYDLIVLLNKSETENKVASAKTAAEKLKQQHIGYERLNEVKKLSRAMSTDLEKSLNIKPDFSQLNAIENKYKADLEALTKRYNELMAPYKKKNKTLSFKEREELMVLEKRFEEEKRALLFRYYDNTASFEVNRTKKNFDDFIKRNADPNGDRFENLEAIRNQDIAMEEAKRDAALAPINEKMEILNQGWNIATLKLSEYNKSIDELQRDIQEAKSINKSMENQIKLEEEYFDGDSNTETYTVNKEVDYEKTIVLEPKTKVIETYTEKKINEPEVKIEEVISTTTETTTETVPNNEDEVSFNDSETMKFAQTTVTTTTTTTTSEFVEVPDDESEEKTVTTKQTEVITLDPETETKTYTETVSTQVTKEIDDETEGMTFAKESIAYSKEAINLGNKNIIELREMAKIEQNKIDAIIKAINTLKAQTEEINAAYVNAVNKIEKRHIEDVEHANQQSDKSIVSLINPALKVINVYNGLDKTLLSGSLLKDGVFSQMHSIILRAQSLVTGAESQALKFVDQAVTEIEALEDKIYLPVHYASLKTIHDNLMTNLLKIPAEKLTSSVFSPYKNATAVMDIVQAIYQKVLMQSACKDNICKTEDKEYFVGSLPKKRDFRAPKRAPATYSPPLREAVYFDDVDYEVMPKSYDSSLKSNAKVSKADFMTYNKDIPEVWKFILEDKAFVERDIDLKKLMNQGNEAFSFVSGGIYPCNYNKYTVTINKVKPEWPENNNYAYTVNARIESPEDCKECWTVTPTGGKILNQKKFEEKAKETSGYPDCKAIQVGNRRAASIIDINMIDGKKYYYDIYDIEGDLTGKSSAKIVKTTIGKLGTPTETETDEIIAAEVAEKPEEASELGTFLTLKENSLMFNSAPFDIFEYLIILSEKINNDPDYKMKINDYMFQRAVFNNNQIGDFLNFVDREQKTRQSRDMLAAKVLEAKEELFKELRAVGYEPKEDFDLAIADDYNLVVSKLDANKNSELGRAVELVKEIDVSGNEPAQERLDNLKRTITAMQKDRDEILFISDVTPSGSEFDEALTAERANLEATKAYKDNANQEFEKQLKNTPQPYCAIY